MRRFGLRSEGRLLLRWRLSLQVRGLLFWHRLWSKQAQEF